MSTNTRFEDGKLIVTRVYAAPRELVFEAWVETSKVQKWWGCAQCTNVRSEIEPKVGGSYNHHMTIEGAPSEIPGFATLVEYDPPNRLAYETSLPGDSNSKMNVTVDFSETTDGTQVQLIHSGIPDMKVDGDIELRTIVREGWTAAFGKLDTLMQTEVG